MLRLLARNRVGERLGMRLKKLLMKTTCISIIDLKTPTKFGTCWIPSCHLTMGGGSVCFIANLLVTERRQYPTTKYLRHDSRKILSVVDYDRAGRTMRQLDLKKKKKKQI